MDEDTDLKSAGLKGFGGSIPFLSAKKIEMVAPVAGNIK
jgi:hypothetical protein